MSDKEIVLAALTKLHTAGKLTPTNVVEDARPTDAPLHDRFQWDDSVCGQRYREDQARSLIRAFKPMIVVHHQTIHAPMFVETPGKGAKREQGYTTLVELRDERASALEALKREFGCVRSLMERTRNIAIRLGLEREFNEMTETLMEEMLILERKAEKAARRKKAA